MVQGFIPQGSEFLVNTYTAGPQNDPSVTGLSDGGYVVTWTSSDQNGLAPGIFGQRYDASGTTVGGEFQIGAHAVGDQYMSAITALPDGGFMAVWAASGLVRSNTEIYGQRYDANGATVGAEFQINTYTANGQWFPSITTLEDGGFVAIWHSEEQDGSDYGVYGQRYDASGVTVGAEFQVNTYTDYRQSYPDVASLSDGGFVVTWTLEDYINLNYGTMGQRYDASGAAVGGEFQISSDTSLSAEHTSVAVLSGGGFVVTWTARDGDSYTPYRDGIFGQRYDANGTAIGGEFLINTYTDQAQQFSDVTGLADGGFVVTWASYGQDESPGTGIFDLPEGGIFGQRYDANGVPIGDEFQINTYISDTQSYPSVASLTNGGFVVSWQSEGQDATGGLLGLNYGVYAQQFQAQLFGATLSGTSSDDTLIGGDGADRLIGMVGDDILVGGTGVIDLRDLIYGGDGNDTIDGGYGNDELRGDAGDDNMAGGFGADTVIGGTGNDVMTGSAYGDLLFGGDGFDFINGGFGHDRINGGADGDKFYHLGIKDHGSDWIQDYNAAEGDVLLWGGGDATVDDFLIQRAETANAGVAGVEEIFVTHIPSGNLLWALVDGDAQDQINIQIAWQVYDLLA